MTHTYMFFDPEDTLSWEEKLQQKKDEILEMEKSYHEVTVERPDDFSEADAESIEELLEQKVSQYNTICQNLPEDHPEYQAP